MIYADNAATTRISDSVFEKMLPFLQEEYGNASSRYSLGIKAKNAIDHARIQVARALGAESPEIVFTSGGSETNNWVLRSVCQSYTNEPIHIVTSCIEHPSVLKTCFLLEKSGVEVTYLPVDNRGRVCVDDVKTALKPHTKLVSIMFVNNEIGTIEPISAIGKITREQGVLFHTDAVQAVAHIPIDVHSLNIDFLTASAHKFNGAKGTGILFNRSGLKLSPLVCGGEQEKGLRAGTENIASIVAAGYAIEESVRDMHTISEHLKTLVSTTLTGIKDRIPNVRVNNEITQSHPGILNISFDNVAGETLMNLLDLKGICVSTSSACTSGRDTPSHVLMALGLTEKQATFAIRISYGKYNSIDEAKTIVFALDNACRKVRKAKLLVE